MKGIRATDIARALGIPPRTMQDICQNDKEFAYKAQGVYWVRLSALAMRPGMDEVRALLILQSRKWIKSTDFARVANISRKTVNNWIRSRPNFGVRIGRNWYIPIDSIARTEEEANLLEQMTVLGHFEAHNER